MVLVPQRLCGRPPLRAGPPVDQRLKLLSYLHVQLHDTHVALTLAAILGSHREATVFLRLVEYGKQLGFRIDHHGDALHALMSETTEPHDCSTVIQSLEYVDDTKGARDWFDRLRRANPALFAHWPLCHGNGRTSGAV